MVIKHRLSYFLGLLFLLASCTGPRQLLWDASNIVSVQVAEQSLASTTDCEGRFVTHTLPFATGVRMREINTYESNGAGLAINDLDGDGLLDIVFASVDREATILWNEGGLKFRPEPLSARFTRAVNIVDVDGDGLLDIVFTHRGLQSVSFWRNQGEDGPVRFVQEPLAGVTAYAYSMAWADLNGDGALDLVTGSYNVDLRQQGVEQPEQDPNAGVYYHERRGDRFEGHLLSPHAEALAIGLVDLDGDGQLDIWVANDFVVQDQFWLRTQAAAGAEAVIWTATRPFRQTSHSTMSIDWGDLDNDGKVAFLTTDMNPDDISVETLAAWLPVIAKLEQPHGTNDPQIMANVLNVAGGFGGWRNQASPRGIEATGWSWAGKFGDLDNDGWLDLYIVNGMIAANLFGHLPNGELIEENRAFRNQGDRSFVPAPAWGLGSTASGRGMMMADLDNDGDLDIVVNNLRASAQFFENRLCGGASLQVELRWPDAQNSYAIGAQLLLRADSGVYLRDVRSASGYLSGDPVRVHFGFPAEADLETLEIVWPDGAVSQVERPAPQTLLTVMR